MSATLDDVLVELRAVHSLLSRLVPDVEAQFDADQMARMIREGRSDELKNLQRQKMRLTRRAA